MNLILLTTLTFLALLLSGCGIDIDAVTSAATEDSTTPKIEKNLVLQLSPLNAIPGFDNTPQFLVQGIESGDKVTIFKDQSCLTPLGSATASDSEVTIQSQAIASGIYNFYFTVETDGKLTIPCSESPLSYGTWPQNSSEVLFSGSVAGDSFAFVGMDVSIDKNLALLSIGSGADCLSAVDISDLRSPSIFHTIGTGSTPAVNGNTCRAVQMVGDTNSFILPNFQKHTEVWDMSPTLTDTLNWTREEDLFTSTKQVRRVDRLFDKGGHYSFLMAAVGGLLKMELDKTTSNLTVVNGGTDAYDPTDSIVYQDGVLVNDDLIVATVAGVGNPVKVFDSSSALVKTIPLDNATSYMWSSATSESQEHIAIGGKHLALLSYDQSEIIPADRVELHGEMSFNSSMRHMEFIDYDGQQYLVAAFSDGSVKVFNTDDLDAPVLVRDFPLPEFTSEAYDIKVFPDKHLIFVTGLKGRFAILNLYKILNP